MRCEIKVREIKNVRRLRDVFILQKCYCLIKGICSKGENGDVPIHIKDHMDALSSPLQLDILKRLKNDIHFFITGWFEGA